MVRVVYIDVLFLVNFLINYLMLFATGKLNGAFVSRPKLLLSAASGALYCCVVFFVELSGVIAVVMKIAAGSAMVMLSFEWRKKFLRLFLSFCGVSFAFGGCVLHGRQGPCHPAAGRRFPGGPCGGRHGSVGGVRSAGTGGAGGRQGPLPLFPECVPKAVRWRGL